MMKLIFFVLSFGTLSGYCIAQTPRFEIKFSEPLAVFLFMQRISPHAPDNPFKSVFEKSPYNRAPYRGLIASFDSLDLGYSYDYLAYPFMSRMTLTTDRILKKGLIDCISLDDFQRRMLGFLPNADLFKLSDILAKITPIYQELIYNPNKQVFEGQISNIRDYIARKNFATFFKTGLTFYGSSWNYNISLNIVFYPLPNPHGFSAESFFNDAVCAIPTNLDAPDLILSIMMHEVFHMLYNEQPLTLKNNIHQWFAQDSSHNSTYAYLLMNEAIASALGNDYVYKSLYGARDTSGYNQKYIDQMSKKAAPLIDEYISQQKTIDQQFVDRYIALYEPEWSYELPNLMTYRAVLSDDKAAFDEIDTDYPYVSYADYEDGVTQANLQKLASTPVTKIVIVSKDRYRELERLKDIFPELRNEKFDQQKEFTAHYFLKDKTQLIIINTLQTPAIKLLNKSFEVNRSSLNWITSRYKLIG
jgi:hypothetical protein